ncbi:MAG: endopeptidase [Rhizobiales bacterium]|nr:endopeptidase [Hyphomicrobiales bacterium]
MSSHDPFDLEGQEQHRKAKDDRDGLDRKNETEDIRWLMSGPRGRRIAYRFLERAGIWQSSFTGNSETFFREGRRDMGLQLLASINTTCPDAYAKMIEEARQNGRSSSGNRSSSNSNDATYDDNGTN